MIENAKKLFDAVTNKIGSSSNALQLSGGSGTGYAPSQPGLIESQDEVSLALRTGSTDSRGILTGVGFFVGAVGLNGSRLQNARVLSFTSSGLFIFGSSLSIWLKNSSTLKLHDIPGYFHGYK